MSYNSLCNIRLATSSGGLSKGYLIHSWGIPEPDLPIYNDSAQRVPISNGGIALRGFPSVTLTWNAGRLNTRQARTIRKIVEDAGSTIYVTVDVSWNGSQAQGYWVDFSGVPQIPVITPSGNTNGRLREQLTLLINNLVEVNNPAVF